MLNGHRFLKKLPAPYDNCVSVPISYKLTMFRLLFSIVSMSRAFSVILYNRWIVCSSNVHTCYALPRQERHGHGGCAGRLHPHRLQRQQLQRGQGRHQGDHTRQVTAPTWRVTRDTWHVAHILVQVGGVRRPRGVQAHGQWHRVAAVRLQILTHVMILLWRLRTHLTCQKTKK